MSENDPFAKLNSITPKPSHQTTPVQDRIIERVSEELGFAPDIPRSQVYKRRPGDVPEPKTQVSIRPALSDWNYFVEWCTKNRYSYNEGFKHLVNLLKIDEAR